jgi:hypothetical protein
MIAHSACSLLVKLLDMKMWDGSLKKYYISSLVCPLSRTWEFTVNSHSSQPQDFLDPKNSLAWREHHDQIEFELASWWGKLESSLYLLLPTTCRQYYHHLHRCQGNFFTHPPLPDCQNLARLPKSSLIAYCMYEFLHEFCHIAKILPSCQKLAW